MPVNFELAGVSVIGSLAFAILFRTPRRYLVHTVTLGCTASVLLQLLRQSHGLAISTFLTTMAIGISGLLLARVTGKPTQGFLIPSVIFLVPGVRIYQAIDLALADRFSAAIGTMAGAMIVIVSISFALLLSNWLIPTKKYL